MKKIILSVFLSFLMLPIFSKGRFVKCTSSDPKDNQIIKVAQTSEKTEIIGNIKRTTVELIITNSSNKILEGEFEFPLESGESVTGFALDINGKFRKAVAVEKEKGRQVFEDVVRKNIDPGLLEMTVGNSFKTRVYPIPANGFRQIQITFDKKLSATDSLVKKDIVFTQTIGKDTFFYYYPDLSTYLKDNGKIKKTLPSSVSIYYDISSSAENRNIDAELSLIKDYLTTAKTSKINVITFSNQIREKKSFNSVTETIKFLTNQTFDGGTNLNLDFSKEKSEQILLVSDGIHNFGKQSDGSKNNAFKNITIAINSSNTADFLSLNELAYQTVDLNTTSVNEGLNQLIYKNLNLLKLEYDDSIFEQINPDSNYFSFVDDSFCISGILKKKSGKIKFAFGYKNEKTLLEKEIEITSYESDKCILSENVSQLWASERIASLSKSYDMNKDKIISIAKKYTIVTLDTSLIILDNVSDYVRYGIVPPEELLEEYNRLTSRNINLVKNEGIGKIPEEVYRYFEEYRKWWNTDPKEFKKKTQKNKNRDGLQIELFEEERALAANAEEIDILPSTAYESPNFVHSKEISRKVADNSPNKSKNFPEQKATVILQAWSSNAEYLTILKKTPENKMYEKYLELKKENNSSPAFFMEVADYFKEEGLKEEALRILSNLAEMNLENTDILRALGNKLNEWKEYELACTVFEKLTVIKPEIPQFFRDLGLAYNNAGKKQEAINTLWKVVTGKWDSRYNEIQQTVLNDMNSIIAISKNKLDTSSFDKKLMQNFDVDVRIVLTWNTDDCDIDLWVTDPNNEKCFYGNKLTENGGRISRDFVQGYGPEEFVIRKAPKGKYLIQANYFANHQQKLLQPITVQAEVYTNFSRPNQTCQLLTLQLNDIKGTFDIGEIVY